MRRNFSIELFGVKFQSAIFGVNILWEGDESGVVGMEANSNDKNISKYK